MKSNDLLVKCMAWREGDLWIAACLDFTLAAQAYSLDEARAKLHEQIASYVREAMTIDSAHADDLLSRKAPLDDQLRYAFWKAVARRPRLRKTARTVVRRVGLALVKKLAYLEPLPVAVAA